MQSAEKCKSVLKELETSLKTKLDRGEYTRKGGYGDFIRDLNDIQEKYNKCQDLGVKVS